MNKKFTWLLMVILTVFLLSNISYSADNYIRVGLEQHFKGISSISVLDRDIQVSIGNSKYYELNLSSDLIIKPTVGYYLNSGEEFKNYSKAMSYAQTLKYTAIPVINERGWEVYISGKDVNELSDILDKEDYSLVTLGKYAIECYSGSEIIMLANGNSPLCVKSINDVTNIGTASARDTYGYRGTIEIYTNEKKLTAINIIDTEDYLLGVVASEMPSSWNMEALKAQAVAARNYAYTNSGKHNNYDLCDHTDCQQYNGYKGETDNTTKAVNATKGKLAYYNDELINAVYFSSSGGHTISSEYVWETAVGYLKGVEEIKEYNPKEWTRSFTLNDITDYSNQKGYNIGTVTNLYISDTLDGGIVNGLTLIGTNGTKILEKENIKTFFSGSPDGSLDSRNFVISNSTEQITTNNSDLYTLSSTVKEKLTKKDIYVISSEGVSGVKSKEISIRGKDSISAESNKNTVSSQSSGNTVVINGSGWGHGVGMSQCGAQGMAEEGYNYEEILKHYYKDIEIR